ncbi:unnamed protein product [Arctia plantaginis]|uniref:Uncharacterized protein n=1 Tax=Arctia plantaginis TaxID=874455 RepID=A0A8S1AIT5_ARCPL|nr:unnamed protein product [Arctia plantaginis]
MSSQKENTRICCMCGSSPSKDSSITLHRFPKPGSKNALRCELWAKYCFPNKAWSSPKFQDELHSKHKMLCSKHFESTCFIEKKLFRTAVPGVQGILEKTSQKSPSAPSHIEVRSTEDIDRSHLDTPAIIETSRGCATESDLDIGNVRCKTFTETVNEDNKHKLKVLMHNETDGTPAENPQPRKQVLQLRLIGDDGFCDEPIYEVLTDDETEKAVDKKQTATQTAAQNLPAKAVQYAPPVIAAEEQETELTCKKVKNKEYWKLKLKHILHNTQFCGVCLKADVDMNALTDEFEITDDERTYRRSLRDIVDKIFREGEYCPANSQICNNCTKKLIQSYIFIHNAEETSKMLDRHLDELYTKICYVRNNSLKDANNAHSRIYNVVIALDNKDISENFKNSQIKIEKPESHQNEKDQIRDKRKLRTVQDGELLQHLKTRHKHSIHLCTTCNVAFYSAKALGRHIKECHRGEDSKCVTCLQSLTQVELERHQCRFKCPECEEAPCIHHRHLMWYREQMANLAPRAKCAECRYVCTSKDALVAHVNRQHLSLQPHRCASCGHEFYCESHLNKHICTPEKVNEDLHICQYCDKAFSSLYICKRHEKGCEGVQRKYQCDDCPATFDSSKDHMKHRKLKQGKEVFSCSLCDRVFLNDLKRTRHERQAHGQQRGMARFVCVVCQTEFSSKAALELHMRYHEPEAKCQLDTLGQFKSHKHRHRRALTVCEVCGVVISRILFKKHMIAHSMATVSCKTCGKSFQNLTLLRYHQSVHVKSVPCPRCKKLISSAKLWRHFRNHLIQDSLDFKVTAIHGL